MLRLSSTQSESLLLQPVIVRWFVVAGAIIGAVILAYLVGTQQVTLLMICGIPTVVTLVTVWLRDRAWVLIPLSWTLTGSSSLIPMNFSIRDAAIMMSACAYLGYRILSPRDLRQRIRTMDMILALNAAWLLITFLLNPAGFRILGAETIGARGYFNVVLALVAYWIIVRLPNSIKQVSRIHYLVLVGATLTAVINIIVYVAPSATPLLYMFYSGVDITSYIHSSAARRLEIARWQALAPFGMTVIFVLCAKYPPRTLLNPTRWQFYVFALGLAAILASGFRNALLQALAALVLAAWFHRGFRELVIVGFSGVFLLGLFLLGQGRLYELPLPAQRALSWLPGKWSQVVVEDATRSSEGRFQWWKEVIGHKLIKNWWVGDGLAIDIREYESHLLSQDFIRWMTTIGGYHNGPLTTVRAVGIIGLLFFYALIIGSAVYSVKCLNLCRGTVLSPVAAFLAVQLVWFPIHYTFVFGDFASQVPTCIMMLALVRLVERTHEQLAE